jgi:hemerythrin superfamily protein
MAVPLDGIRAIHNAFRADMAAIDAAAVAAARGRGSLDPVLSRCPFFKEFLVWHAEGEEAFVFPAMEKVAPLVAEPYELDHRGLDSLSESLLKAARESEPFEAARTASALRFHLAIHLDKEEAHLYRIFDERVALPDQGAIAAKMAQKIPPPRFPEAVGWLFPLLGLDDRENMIRIWQQALPAPALAEAVKLIRGAVGAGWAELKRRVPELE